jgi:hypothetical protein
MQKLTLGAALSALFLFSAMNAQAQTITVDNGTYATTGAYNISNFAEADDFVTTTAISFNSIRFWAIDNSIAGANLNTLDNFSGTLSWFVHADSGLGVPGASIVTSGTVSSGISITNTGALALGQYPIFEVNVPISSTTLVTPNRYWLRLKEGSPLTPFDGSSIFWARSLNSPLMGFGTAAAADPVNPTGWGDNDRDSAFQLLSAPEPSTLCFFFSALGAVLAYKRRQRI